MDSNTLIWLGKVSNWIIKLILNLFLHLIYICYFKSMWSIALALLACNTGQHQSHQNNEMMSISLVYFSWRFLKRLLNHWEVVGVNLSYIYLNSCNLIPGTCIFVEQSSNTIQSSNSIIQISNKTYRDCISFPCPENLNILISNKDVIYV